MNLSSPLRYPGGKGLMTDLIAQTRSINGLGETGVVEPFAGGAGASLSLLFKEETPEIFINDVDTAIHDFWWAVTQRTDAFVELLAKTRISIPEWRRQRKVYRQTGRVSRLRRGFSVFYLNRCNRSGIIMNGGPIGGIKQEGEWKLNARFNKSELRERCERIREYRERIHISGHDGISLIRKVASKNVFYFIDPPYFAKGKTLYLNSLDQSYHEALGKELMAIGDVPWVLTYDDCPEIRKIYRGWANIRPFRLRYAASERRSGKEILISPKWMRLPRIQSSAAISW
jgi:DNA adenine methylase